ARVRAERQHRGDVCADSLEDDEGKVGDPGPTELHVQSPSREQVYAEVDGHSRQVIRHGLVRLPRPSGSRLGRLREAEGHTVTSSRTAPPQVRAVGRATRTTARIASPAA